MKIYSKLFAINVKLKTVALHRNKDTTKRHITNLVIILYLLKMMNINLQFDSRILDVISGILALSKVVNKGMCTIDTP